MNHDVYVCRLTAMREDMPGSRQPRRVTVYSFVYDGDEARANALTGEAADAWFDATGEAVLYHVEALPYFRPATERQVLADARMAASA